MSGWEFSPPPPKLKLYLPAGAVTVATVLAPEQATLTPPAILAEYVALHLLDTQKGLLPAVQSAWVEQDFVAAQVPLTQ